MLDALANYGVPRKILKQTTMSTVTCSDPTAWWLYRQLYQQSCCLRLTDRYAPGEKIVHLFMRKFL